VAIRKSSEYRRESKRELFQIELDNGTLVTFADPNRLDTEAAYRLADSASPKANLQALLGDEFDVFWNEYRHHPVEECEAVVEDVLEHYGADVGKLRNLSR
jgi:hypothetical protein